MPESETNSVVERLDRIADLLAQLLAKERPKPQRLLRLSEGANYLHISINQLRSAIQRGEIDVVRQSAGSRIPWLVAIDDLNLWIEKNKVTLG